MLKKTSIGIATLVAAGGLITTSSRSAVAATGLTASDVTVSTNDGELNALTVEPNVTVSWSGMEEQVATVAATWNVKTNSNSEEPFGPTPEKIAVDTPTKDGEVSHTYSDALGLLGGDPLSASNFEAAIDGGTENTDVTLSMDVELRDASSNVITSRTEVLGPKTFTVTVTNESSSVSASGTANTGGS